MLKGSGKAVRDEHVQLYPFGYCLCGVDFHLCYDQFSPHASTNKENFKFYSLSKSSSGLVLYFRHRYTNPTLQCISAVRHVL